VNLIAEARDRDALSRGVQGLSVRLARRANAAIDRSGKVFGDRYEVRVLGSPVEAKKALSSVMSAQGAIASSVSGGRKAGKTKPAKTNGHRRRR
jgi:hypothetical protein